MNKLRKPDFADATRGAVSDLFSDKYGEAHQIWVEGHLSLLCELRATFGNDLDKVIIMGVIGQCMLKSQTLQDYGPGTPTPDERGMDRSRFTNIESISASTALPRESVRRKVWELVEQGWVIRHSDGRLEVTLSATDVLAKSTATEIDFLTRTLTQLIRLL